jgi:hypothetical protein
MSKIEFSRGNEHFKVEMFDSEREKELIEKLAKIGFKAT